MDLTAARRDQMPASQFALPGQRFPIPDQEHARLALSGASRAENTGNITPEQAAIVRAKASRMLGYNALKGR
jgi:hypothetical protein